MRFDKLDELLADTGFNAIAVSAVEPYDVPSLVVLQFLCAWTVEVKNLNWNVGSCFPRLLYIMALLC